MIFLCSLIQILTNYFKNRDSCPPLADWAISYCDHWLVDRTFFSVAAMSEFGRADEGFLMYAKTTPGIKKALAEYEDGKRGAVSEHVVKSGRAKFSVLAFVKKAKTGEDGTREEAVLPFFSNMPRRRFARCRPR